MFSIILTQQHGDRKQIMGGRRRAQSVRVNERVQHTVTLLEFSDTVQRTSCQLVGEMSGL